jgi:hypothetical protein
LGAERNLEVVVQITDGQGYILLETTRPLLYGALPPEAWGGEVMQHMQPIALPSELLPRTYHLAVTLREDGRDLTPPRALATIPVEAALSEQIGDYAVPGPLRAMWERLGGDAGPGAPLMPAVPFRGYTLQCFERACLRLASGTARPEPLGDLVHLGDVGLRPVDTQAAPGEVSAAFRDVWLAQGGAEVLGPAVTPELIRGDMIVQYTRYARLERPIAGGAARRASLGAEFLRLPGGVPYRCP